MQTGDTRDGHRVAVPRDAERDREATAGSESVLSREVDQLWFAQVLRAAVLGGPEGERAWRTILEVYGPRVFALTKSRLRNADLAEEITQSVFVTVAAKVRSGEYNELGRFEAWLFRVAMNRVRDEARRVKRQASPVSAEAFREIAADSDARGGVGSVSATGAGTGAGREVFARLRAAMEGLSDADRDIIELRHHAGLNFKQLSDLLGEPLGTLLARHHRALRKLREALGESVARTMGIESGGVGADGAGAVSPEANSGRKTS
jgi:RNA polymerase sigma-70 factor, ECF subfamily